MEKRICTICGRFLKGDVRKEIHAECQYGLQKIKLQIKYYAGRSSRRSLYFSNLLKAIEATREGREVE